MNKNSTKTINLLGEICPMTYVRTKLAIEKIKNKERLKFIYDSEEAKTNVPKSIKEVGHKVIEIKHIKKNNFYIIIEK